MSSTTFPIGYNQGLLFFEDICYKLRTCGGSPASAPYAVPCGMTVRATVKPAMASGKRSLGLKFLRTERKGSLDRREAAGEHLERPGPASWQGTSSNRAPVERIKVILFNRCYTLQGREMDFVYDRGNISYNINS